MNVEELYAYCAKLIKNGHGKKQCFCTTDDEGNDYRPMVYAPTSNPKEVRQLMQYSCSGIGNNDPNDIVIFG